MCQPNAIYTSYFDADGVRDKITLAVGTERLRSDEGLAGNAERIEAELN